MIRNIKSTIAIFLLGAILFSACKKEEYSFGELIAPKDVNLSTTIVGATTALPTGNGTGAVTITSTAVNVITYKVDFGDGTTEVVPSGTITHRYSDPGTKDYMITVNAIGTGGLTSTISKKVRVFVDFQIPENILTALTGGATKVWITAKNTLGHFGVDDPTRNNTDINNWWYKAAPLERDPNAYDDEITFSKDANNNIFMSVDNKGLSFLTGASTSFYGFSGGDGNYAVNTGGNKKLAFANATSGFDANNSTGIKFTVPGNGIINFGTGGTSYEIIAISETEVTLRNIGSDGNAWYQKLTIKP